MTQQEIDAVKEPTKEEFLDRCRNIEEEKKQIVRDNFKRHLEEKFGKEATEQDITDWLEKKKVILISELRNKCIR